MLVVDLDAGKERCNSRPIFDSSAAGEGESNGRFVISDHANGTSFTRYSKYAREFRTKNA
jgi:hypothetical protein